MAVFITPTEISPATTGSWQDADCSSVVPAGATGVMVVVYSTSSTFYSAGARKNGSTDNRTRLMTQTQNYHYVGVDDNRVCELYRGDAAVHYFVVGYFTDDAVFFTNGVNKSTATLADYVDVDISTDTSPDIALAAILEHDGGSGNNLSIRCNGSSDARYPVAGYHIPGGVIIGVDGSQIFEQKISNAYLDLFLLGYIKDKVTINVNAVDRSLGSTGAYADLSALTTGAIGGVIEVYNGAANDMFAVRKKGASHEIYSDARRSAYAAVECDANRIVEGKIETTNVDFFEILVFTSNCLAGQGAHAYGLDVHADFRGGYSIGYEVAEAAASSFAHGAGPLSEMQTAYASGPFDMEEVADAFAGGAGTSQDSRNAHASGFGSPTGGQDAHARGVDASAGARDAFLDAYGANLTIQEAYVGGVSDILEQQDAYLSGPVEAISATDAHVDGYGGGLIQQDTYSSSFEQSDDSRNAYAEGFGQGDGGRDAYAYGAGPYEDGFGAFAPGFQTGQEAQDAYIDGCGPAGEETDAFAYGTGQTTESQPAYARAESLDTYGSQDAFVLGYTGLGPQASDAFVAGYKEAVGGTDAFAHGSGPQEDSVNAFLHAYGQLVGSLQVHAGGWRTDEKSVSVFLGGLSGQAADVAGFAGGINLSEERQAAFVSGWAALVREVSAYSAGHLSSSGALDAFLGGALNLTAAQLAHLQSGDPFLRLVMAETRELFDGLLGTTEGLEAAMETGEAVGSGVSASENLEVAMESGETLAVEMDSEDGEP